MNILKDLTQPQAMMLVGAVTMVNIVLTSFLTHFLSGMRSRSRYRWDEKRVDAYLEYAKSVKKIAYLAVRVSVARGMPYSLEPLSPEEGVPLLDAAEGDCADRFESVLLLGDKKTIEAARDWRRVGEMRVEFAHGRLDDLELWKNQIKEFDDARERFYNHARGDLRVRRGRVPSAHWPPAWMKSVQQKKDATEGGALGR